MDNITQNLPVVGSMIRRQHENPANPTPKNDLIVSINSEYIREHPEILEKYSEISTSLMKMGFPPKLINNLFLIKRFKSLDEAIDLLSKTNDQWNHEYVEGDNDLCFICDEEKNRHFDKMALIEENFQKSKTTSEFQKKSSAEKIHITIQKNPENESSVKINVNSCPICFLEIDEINKFNLSCKHEVCKDCIVSYLEEEIKIARVNTLNCPQKGCEILFTDEQIKNLITEDFFKKYLKFKSRNQIKEDKDLVICPIADCEGYAKISENEKKQGIDRENLNTNILDSETDPLLIEDIKTKKSNKELFKIRYTCINNHNFCGKCMRAWHRNSSCDDDKEILEFATDSGKIVKKCPNCRVWTEKDEGCNHMKCKMCVYDWCWICEGHCPPDHFTKRGTPCYGKQFNDQGDPDMDFIEILQDQTNFFNSVVFFFVFTFLIISSASRQVLMGPNNRRNNSSKFGAWLGMLSLLFIILILLSSSNGIIALNLLANLGKLQLVRNGLSKFLCVLSFLLFWFIFYFFGFLLACFWFLISFIYMTGKIISI